MNSLRDIMRLQTRRLAKGAALVLLTYVLLTYVFEFRSGDDGGKRYSKTMLQQHNYMLHN